MQTQNETTQNRKDEAYWKILSAAIELDFRRGHLKWTLSELSRKSRVTRSLIYYYFGRSKLGILREAVRLIGEELGGLSPRRQAMWERGEFYQSMLESRKISEKAPYLGIFYLKHHNAPTEVGEALREVETNFYQRLARQFPKGTRDQLETLFALYWGGCFAPGISEDALKNLMVLVQKFG